MSFSFSSLPVRPIPLLPRRRAVCCSGTVDVVGIGSRKDAVIDFCRRSPFASSSRLRFWTVDSGDPLKVQLQRKNSEEGDELSDIVFPPSLHPCPLAVILVASAGHGLDALAALELLEFVRSEGGLVVGVFLKPFPFEGKRRQQEVIDLIDKLQKCSQTCIVVETDALLKTEEETLADAIRIVNNAALVSVNIISVLVDNTHLKFLDTPNEELKELGFAEIQKFLQSPGETKVGYGAGYDIKSSISQAVFSCPFLTSDLKNPNGAVVFNLSSAKIRDRDEQSLVIRTFRRITQCTKQIIFCGIHELGFEQNLVISTLLVLGCSEQKVFQKKGLLSSLVHRIPLFFSFLRGNNSETLICQGNLHPDESNLADGMTKGLGIDDSLLENPGPWQGESDARGNSNCGENTKIINVSNGDDKTFSSDYSKADEDGTDLQREPVNSWMFGPGFHIAKLWAEEREALSETTSNTDRLDIFPLPVGVKSLEQSINGCPSEAADFRTSDGRTDTSLSDLNFASKNALSGEKFFNKKIVGSSRKQGQLSVRAASMLETERETEKQWTPVIQMQYRGGLYKGRCQGGIPEGKSRLTFPDGSFYEGMWRFGKRSGSGIFCYSNGDVFQGSWRDDVMDGKGWFYFHTGDRWFANFWKGKANGEGRFYSKSGSVFFGNFRNGWRHGEFLCIGADGSRSTEVWAEGSLVSQSKLDPGSCG